MSIAIQRRELVLLVLGALLLIGLLYAVHLVTTDPSTRCRWEGRASSALGDSTDAFGAHRDCRAIGTTRDTTGDTTRARRAR